MRASDPDRHWHLDRRVPVALIITIVMQTIGIVWWAANLSARVDALELRIREARDNQNRIIRLEANQAAVSRRLDRMLDAFRRVEAKLDKLLLKQRAGGPR